MPRNNNQDITSSQRIFSTVVLSGSHCLCRGVDKTTYYSMLRVSTQRLLYGRSCAFGLVRWIYPGYGFDKEATLIFDGKHSFNRQQIGAKNCAVRQPSRPRYCAVQGGDCAVRLWLPVVRRLEHC